CGSAIETSFIALALRQLSGLAWPRITGKTQSHISISNVNTPAFCPCSPRINSIFFSPPKYHALTP
ncbi:MAG: hypothetical protein ACI4V2_02260, partial [Alloprevotella sp.]